MMAKSKLEGATLKFSRKQFLVLAASAVGSWALVIAAVAGGYHAGGYVISWFESTPEVHAEGGEDPADLDLIAKRLSDISPASGSD